jgi:hypothetical protein
MRNRKRMNRGGAMLEFALLCPIWLSLLLGTLWYGTAMVRGLMVTQTARDLASMYCRSVDFSATGTGTAQTNILPKLVRELGTISATGTGVIVFSRLTYVGADQCQLAGSPTYWNSASSTPVVTATGCHNYQHFVFTQRYIVGKKGLRNSSGDSSFGAPLDADLDSTKQYAIPITTYVKNDGDRADKFTLLPSPDVESGGYSSGQPVYAVEVFFAGTSQANYGGGGAYAYAIF